MQNSDYKLSRKALYAFEHLTEHVSEHDMSKFTFFLKELQDFEKTFNLIDIDIDGWEELEDRTNMSVVNLEESKVSITVKGLRSDISKLSEKTFFNLKIR